MAGRRRGRSRATRVATCGVTRHMSCEVGVPGGGECPAAGGTVPQHSRTARTEAEQTMHAPFAQDTGGGITVKPRPQSAHGDHVSPPLGASATFQASHPTQRCQSPKTEGRQATTVERPNQTCRKCWGPPAEHSLEPDRTDTARHAMSHALPGQKTKTRPRRRPAVHRWGK